MSVFKKTLLPVLALTALMPVCHAQQQQLQQPPPLPGNIVAGKVVAVSHEKVSVNNAWLDKVSVQVDSCDAPGKLRTVFYSPATISDRAALGHLFHQNYAAALMPNMERLEHTPNGLGLFWIDANGRVLRTGLLGSQTGCNDVMRLVQQFK